MYNAAEGIDYSHFKAAVKNSHYQSQLLNVWAEVQGLYKAESDELAELNAICASLDAEYLKQTRH
ncbi:hypothetical protein, partial [Sansalvadorimonas verongulae]|uniref:hypothetical protein n=1 Tax=Sansalvadorimonas verongulae TaxID=2172824 RepID=UPI0018AD26DD